MGQFSQTLQVWVIHIHMFLNRGHIVEALRLHDANIFGFQLTSGGQRFYAMG